MLDDDTMFCLHLSIGEPHSQKLNIPTIVSAGLSSGDEEQTHFRSFVFAKRGVPDMVVGCRRGFTASEESGPHPVRLDGNEARQCKMYAN